MCCASEPVQTGRVGLYNQQQVGFTPFCRLSSVIQPTIGWGYIFFRTAAATELVGLCKQHCLDAVYLGLCVTMSCFLQVAYDSVLFSSSCVQCLHAYHSVVNVSTHITWW